MTGDRTHFDTGEQIERNETMDPFDKTQAFGTIGTGLMSRLGGGIVERLEPFDFAQDKLRVAVEPFDRTQGRRLELFERPDYRLGSRGDLEH